MEPPSNAAGSAEAAWLADQRRWAQGWRRVVFPTLFLAWLVDVGVAVANDSHGPGIVTGEVILAAFCVIYVVTLLSEVRAARGHYLLLVVVLLALTFAELPFAHADAFVMAVFVCTVVVIPYGEKGLPLVAALTVATIFLPVLISSWHDSFSTSLDNGTALAIPLVGLAMFGFGRVIQGNGMLAGARTELARLAAENERMRIARDLHDLLGHSLTTIAVKAELAERLSTHHAQAAANEIREVAALSRRALGDVRAAVSNYREVTLAGELATGRELLRAAGISAELPAAVEVADDATQELFGWVVREGLTNVVRHSRARSCEVHVSARSVEIVDDGNGGAGRRGSGLSGLSERVEAAGGLIEAGPAQPRGWRLAVTLPGRAPAEHAGSLLGPTASSFQPASARWTTP